MNDEPGAVARQRPAVLTSNGVPIPFDADHFAPMRDATDLVADPAALRAAFREQGYLLLRSVLDADMVRAVRRDYFALFDPSLLAPGTTPADGVYSGSEPPGPPYGTEGHPAHAFVRDARFDAFTRTPELRGVAEALLDGPVELLPRRILRHFHRDSGAASRAHVDFDYMDHGTDEVVTAWIPLGDCPVESGGLVYLDGTHELPRAELDGLRAHTDRPDDSRPLTNDLALTAETLGRRWLWADFRSGDVVLHSPHIVHASLDNANDVMRLSADVRFRRSDGRADERWNAPWSADDGF